MAGNFIFPCYRKLKLKLWQPFSQVPQCFLMQNRSSLNAMSLLPSTLASFMFKTAIFFLSLRVMYTNNAYYHFQLSTSCYKLCILMKTWCSTVICKYNVTVNDVRNENYIAFLCYFLMMRLPGKWKGKAWPRFGTRPWYWILGIIFTLFWLKRA